jgi:hypothetical protein
MPRYERITDPRLIAELQDRMDAQEAGVDYERVSRTRSFKDTSRNGGSGFRIVDSGLTRGGVADSLFQGIGDNVVGLAQAGTHALNSIQHTLGMDPNHSTLLGGDGLFSDDEVRYADATAQIRNRQIERDRSTAGRSGADIARLAGNFAAPPVARVARFGRAANALANGALQGGVAAGLQPVVGGDGNFLQDKLGQVTTGAVLGAGTNLGLSKIGARFANRGRNPSQLETRLQAGNRQGIDLSLSEASGNGIVRAASDVMSNLPGGGALVRNAERNANKFDSIAENAASDVGRTLSRPEMGNHINGGLRGFVSRFQNKSTDMYRAVDSHVAPETSINMTNTLHSMRDTAEGFTSLPELGRKIANSELMSFADTLTGKDGNARNLFFTEAQRLRTQIGMRLGEPTTVNSIPRRELAKVYSALTDDMRTALANNPEGLRAFDEASQYYKSGMNHIQKVIDPILKTGSDERAADKVLNMLANDAQGTKALRESLTVDEWDDVAASIFHKLGDVSPGMQDAAAEGFSIPAFATGFNKLRQNKEAFNWAFGGTRYANLRDTYGDLAVIADSIKQSKRLSNPSRSGYTSGLIGLGTMFITVPQIAAKAVGSNFIMSKLMSSPAFARWIVKTGKVVNRGLRGGSAGSNALMQAQIAKLPAIAASNTELAEGVSNLYSYFRNEKPNS